MSLYNIISKCNILLGSGYGHWTWTALAALSLRSPQRLPPTHFLLVDVVPALAPVIAAMAARNMPHPRDERRHVVHFHAGFVAGSAHPANLSSSQQKWANFNVHAYTHTWATHDEGSTNEPSAATPVSLAELLNQYAVPCPIHVLDVDVQGAEYELFAGAETMRLLKQRVRRVHIGVHGMNLRHGALKSRFDAANWTRTWYFPRGRIQTDFGAANFADGVLSLVNRHGPQCD